jgi:TolA-binding protein
MMKNRGLRAGLLTLVLAVSMVSARPAHATSKEIIELQTQVQQLMDMVQRLQSTMDTKYGVLQHLVEQAADNTNQLNASFSALQLKITSQNEALTGKLDTASGQSQSVNDSLDELKSRLERLDKQLQEVKGQLQSMQTQINTAQPTTGTSSPTASGQPAAGGTAPVAAAAPVNSGPPIEDTYQSGLRDYNAAHYSLAESEFNDVIRDAPQNALAGSAEFYLGEISYREKNYDNAIKHYNTLLEKFDGNNNSAAAQLHKSYALIALKKREAAIHELHSLIERHPQTPEADQAKNKLAALEATR